MTGITLIFYRLTISKYLNFTELFLYYKRRKKTLGKNFEFQYLFTTMLKYNFSTFCC